MLRSAVNAVILSGNPQITDHQVEVTTLSEKFFRGVAASNSVKGNVGRCTHCTNKAIGVLVVVFDQKHPQDGTFAIGQRTSK